MQNMTNIVKMTEIFDHYDPILEAMPKQGASQKDMEDLLIAKYTDLIKTGVTNEELVKPLCHFAYTVAKCPLPDAVVLLDSPPAMYSVIEYIEHNNGKISDDEIVKWAAEYGSTSHLWQEYTRNVYPLYNYLNIADYNWVAYYDLQLLQNKTVPSEFPEFKKYITANLFCVCFYDKLALCCRCPTVIKLDDRRRLHAFDGPALVFQDLVGYYFIYGNNIEPALYHKMIDHQTEGIPFLSKMADRSAETNPADILNIGNTELKAHLIEHIGYENLLEHLPNVKQLDKQKFKVKAHDDDSWHWWTGILFEFELEGVKVHLLRVQNPHDKRPAFLITNPNVNTVKESRNSTFNQGPDFEFEYES
jgi:hypothetical protein